MTIVSSDGVNTVEAVTSEFQSSLLAPDIINVVRGLRLNNLRVPKWIALEYNAIESRHETMPVVPQSRMDKLVAQRYSYLFPKVEIVSNIILDGFRLDICFKDIKLNVELDGPSHRWELLIKRNRKNIIRAKNQLSLYLKTNSDAIIDKIFLQESWIKTDIKIFIL